MSERASSALRSPERLSARRRRNRRRALIALLLLFAAALGGFIALSWRDSMRIDTVTVYGSDQALAEVAYRAMEGSYLGVFPRNSSFFYPERAIRRAILATRPDIAAISLFRDGFTGLTLKVDERTPIARWCGLAPTPGADEYCYLFDPNGYLYMAAASTTETVNAFALYARLAGETEEPLGASLADAAQVPGAFEFARRLATLGSPALSIIIANGEVTDHLASGTRVIYLLGKEQDAITALVSSGEKVNLADGSVEYVDLRFDGKVYLKRAAEE